MAKASFIRFAKTVDAELVPIAAAIVGKFATDAASWAAVNAPYQYGPLSASVQAARVGALQWRVNVGQSYGLEQEYGTRYMKAQPFLVPSVLAHRAPFFDAMQALKGPR